MGDLLKMKDIFKRWTEYLDNTQSRVNNLLPVNCVFCGGEHVNDDCHLYSMKNSWWEQELLPYNQYEEERTPTLESVLTEFTAYHPSSTTNQNPMQNQEIQVGKSYSMENYQWEQELQPYNQYEEEKISHNTYLEELGVRHHHTINSFFLKNPLVRYF